MTPGDDRLDVALASLRQVPMLDADGALAARIRGRCHTAMGRRTSPDRLREAGGPVSWRLLVPAFVAAACVVYLSEVVSRAWSLLGM